MDQFTRHYFGMTFKVRFLEALGDNFQLFFGQIMNLRYPGDFTQTRPWGNRGDNKCDGYLPSQGKFYQCYAPAALSENETIRKIDEDFNGALPFHPQYFDTWVFVNNARDGRIPAWLTLKLQNLRQNHQTIAIETLGYMELLQICLALNSEQLVDLFGLLPTLEDMIDVQFKDIKPILNNLSHYADWTDSAPNPVSPEKLNYNHLGEDVKQCLRHGMIKSKIVREYLDQTMDKELASRITGAFHHKYQQLKEEQREPDDIFYGLKVFAQGPFAQEPKTEGAVLAILSYLFEECDIFENPPGNEVP